MLAPACSGSSGQAEERGEVTAETGEALSAAVRAYGEIVTGEDDRTVLSSIAAMDSPAYVYAQHLLAALALLPPSTVHATVVPYGSGLRVCDPPPDDEAQGETACNVLDRFQMDDDGRIRTFSLNGEPVDGRVTRGLGTGTVIDGITVAVETAVVSTGGNLNIVFVVSNGTDGPLTPLRDDLRYQTAGGEAAERSDYAGGFPPEIPPGNSFRMIGLFENSDFGGSLAFFGRMSQGKSVEIDVPVPTPG